MALKTEFRASTPADAAGILHVLEAAGLRPHLQPSGLHWKYWEPREDWTEPRSFVMARGPDIIAHAAIVPGYCAWGNRRFRVLHAIDWAARPREAGAGISVMKHISAFSDALLAIGGSEQTQRILPHIGFRFAGSAIGYVRPLRPLRLLRASAGPLWKLPPRLARRVFWTLSAPRGLWAGWGVRALDAEQAHALASVLPAPDAERGMAVLERSQSSLCYALRCPVSPTRLFAVQKTDQMIGYFLLTFPPGQARIADCWVNSPDVQDWCAMLQCAVNQARQHREAAELVCRASDPMLQRSLTACGFHPRTKEPIQIRANVTFPVPPASLRVQLIDDDAAYRHVGRPWLLT